MGHSGKDRAIKAKAFDMNIVAARCRPRHLSTGSMRPNIEEALYAMLDAEADRLCGASKYERIEGRKDTRAGSYERSLDTKAGPVKLKIPKLRKQIFETTWGNQLEIACVAEPAADHVARPTHPHRRHARIARTPVHQQQPTDPGRAR